MKRLTFPYTALPLWVCVGCCILLGMLHCAGPVPGPLPDSPSCLTSQDCVGDTVCQRGTCVKRSGNATEIIRDHQTDGIPDSPRERDTATEPAPDKESLRESAGDTRDAGPVDNPIDTVIDTSNDAKAEAHTEPTQDAKRDAEKPDNAMCNNGDSRTCYTGAPNTRNVGECKDGKQQCAQGIWGPCIGDVTPSAETCDGKDNNCNNTTDENLSRPCYTGPAGTQGKGTCKGGIQRCNAGSWGSCLGQVLPSPDKCDGTDTDCDGKPNTKCLCTLGTTQPCGIGTPPCRKGTRKCEANGQWGTCIGAINPKQERCNNIDDNCNGTIDESPLGIGVTCNTGKKGECAKGKTVCTNGRVVCQQSITATTEKCDGKDNDCDGVIDSYWINSSCTDSTKKGECRKGTYFCSAGRPICRTNAPTKEICDGKDTDCNGRIDTCNQNQTRCVNATALQKCTRDCESWSASVTCAKGCRGGKCCACTPGQTRCKTATGRQLETCSNDCQNWVTTNCPSSMPHCFDPYMTTCKYCACVPGNQTCNGGNRRICRNDCNSYSLIPCQGGTQCVRLTSRSTVCK